MTTAVLTADRATQGVDTILVRIVFRRSDDAIYRWSGVGITDLSTGEHTEARVISIDDMIVQLSDRRGNYQASSLSFTLSDLPDPQTGEMLLRGFLGDPSTSALLGVEVTFEVTTQTDLEAGNDWIQLGPWLVDDYEQPAGYLFRVTCRTWLDPRLDQNVPLSQVRDAFPLAPTTSLDRYLPRWYGRQTDGSSATAAPTVVNESGTGASGPDTSSGQPIYTAGYGNKGGTVPTTPALSAGGSGGVLDAGTWYGVITFTPTGGDESEQAPFLSTLSASISGDQVLTATCDDMGSGKYRAYFGRDGYRFDRYVESNTPTMVHDGANGLPSPTPWIWVFGVRAQMADGLTAFSPQIQSVGMGPKRVLRFAWEAVTGAESYMVDAAPAVWEPSRVQREWTVPTTQVNDDGNLYFEWDQSTSSGEVVSGLPAEQGKIPGILIGSLDDADGVSWTAIGFACHPMTIDDLYLVTVADNTVRRIDDGEYGVTVLAPGQAGWSTFLGSPAPLYIVGADGARCCVALFRGPDAESLIDGTLVARANASGVEDVGDGTGNPIESIFDQKAHLEDNLLLTDDPIVDDRDWVTAVPAWPSGRTRRDTASYAAAKAASTTITGDDGAAAFGILSPITWRTLLGQLAVDSYSSFGVSQFGQLVCVLTNRSAAAGFTLTEQDDIFRQKFATKPDRRAFANVLPYSYAPVYDAEGTVTYRNSGSARNADSITAYARVGKLGVPDDPVNFIARTNPSAIAAIAREMLVFSAAPPQAATLTGGLHLLHRALGDVAAVSHREGLSASGWSDYKLEARALQIGLFSHQVQLVMRDMAFSASEADELFAEYDLGGSWYHSPAFLGTSPETANAYEYRDVLIPWSKISGASVFVYINAKVSEGVTLTPQIWNLTDEEEAAYASAPSAVSSTSFVQQIIQLTRPSDNTDKLYRLKATVSGAGSPSAVWFLAAMRYGTGVELPTHDSSAITLTVPSGTVSEDLTDYPLFVDLSTMPDRFWGGLAFDDGRDIRVQNASGTDIPFDLIAIDVVAKTGGMFCKTSLAVAADTTVKITFGDDSLSAVDPDAANGRHSVWSDYASVYVPTAFDGWVDHAGNAGKLVQDANCASLVMTQLSAGVAKGHQGIATDGTYFYVVDTNSIQKYDASWTMLGANSNPNGASGLGTVHCGGPACVGTTLYIPMADSSGNVWISRFDTSTLAFVSAVSIPNNPAGLGYNSDDGFLYGCDYGGSCTEFWKYDLSTLAFVAAIPLSSAVPSSDGLVWWRGYWWFSSEATTVNTNGTTKRWIQVAADGTVVNDPLWLSVTNVDTFEGACVGTDDRPVLDYDSQPWHLDPVTLLGGAGGGIKTALGGLAASSTPFGQTFTMGATVSFSSVSGSSNQPVIAFAVDNSNYIVAKRYGATGVWAIKDSSNGLLLSSTSPVTNTPARLHCVYNGTVSRELFQNGVSILSDAGIIASPASGAQLWLAKGISGQSDGAPSGTFGFAYLRLEALPAAWLAAEYANLFTPSDFYTVGA